MNEFKKKYGSHIADDRLPAQSLFEHFSEKVADGTLKAEPLSHMVSLFEEDQQELKKKLTRRVSTTCSWTPCSARNPHTRKVYG